MVGVPKPIAHAPPMARDTRISGGGPPSTCRSQGERSSRTRAGSGRARSRHRWSHRHPTTSRARPSTTQPSQAPATAPTSQAGTAGSTTAASAGGASGAGANGTTAASGRHDSGRVRTVITATHRMACRVAASIRGRARNARHANAATSRPCQSHCTSIVIAAAPSRTQAPRPRR